MSEITNADEARAIMEEARQSYRELVQGLSANEWNRPSNNGGWTNGQLCWHIAFGAGLSDNTISRLRRNKAMNPPGPIMKVFDFISLWIVRIRSRGATPESVLARFDRGYGKTFKLIDTIADDEWGKGGVVLGDHMTVGGAFRFLGEHVAEHAAEVQRD